MERHLWAGPISNSSYIPRSKHSIWQVLVHNTCLLNRYLELRNKAVSPKQWLFSYEDIGVENSPLVSYWSSIFSPLVGISFQGPDLALPVNTLREEGGHLFKKKKSLKRKTWTRNMGRRWEEKTVQNFCFSSSCFGSCRGEREGNCGQESGRGIRSQETGRKVMYLVQ